MICNAPLLLHQSLTSKLCGKESCRHHFEAMPAHRRCVVCDRPLPAAAASETACATVDCQSIYLGRLRAKELERVRALVVEAVRVRRTESAALLSILNSENYPIQIVPAFDNPTTTLPTERKEEFKANLKAAIAEAFAGPSELALPSGDPALPADSDCGCGNGELTSTPERVSTSSQAEALGIACATCRGYCCRNGQTHAFLTADVLRQQRERHPERTPQEMFDAYASLLPQESLQDSCVFQGETGCVLPGDMRAQVCHDFFCPDLAEFKTSMAERQSRRAFLAAANDEGIRRQCFVDD